MLSFASIVLIVTALSFWLNVNSVEAAQCLINNGAYKSRVGPIGAPTSWQCVYTYSDAGKKCTSSEECEGNCLMTDDTRFRSTHPLKKEYVSGYGICEETNEWSGCTSGTIETPFVMCE